MHDMGTRPCPVCGHEVRLTTGTDCGYRDRIRGECQHCGACPEWDLYWSPVWAA